MAEKLLTLDDICEELAISKSQAYALVQKGDLRALKIGRRGGRGEWRVERPVFEAWIAQKYEDQKVYAKRWNAARAAKEAAKAAAAAKEAEAQTADARTAERSPDAD